MHLRHAQRRSGEPFAKIRDVLTHQIPGWRDEADVALFFDHRVDGDAQHDFGFARSGRRLEQKLDDVVIEAGADRVDRRALILGQGERFAGRDQLVRERDGLRVAVDRRPDVVS